MTDDDWQIAALFAVVAGLGIGLYVWFAFYG